jgi:hypothetical protein
MAPLVILLLGGCSLCMYVLYRTIHYLVARYIISAPKLLLIVFLIDTVLIFLASIPDLFNVINLVFLVSVFAGTVVVWLTNLVLSRSKSVKQGKKSCLGNRRR